MSVPLSFHCPGRALCARASNSLLAAVQAVLRHRDRGSGGLTWPHRGWPPRTAPAEAVGAPADPTSLLRTRCQRLAGRCAAHILTVFGNTLNGNVLTFPLLDKEKLSDCSQPLPWSQLAFHRAGIFLSSLFQPIGFSFWHQLVGIGRKEKRGGTRSVPGCRAEGVPRRSVGGGVRVQTNPPDAEVNHLLFPLQNWRTRSPGCQRSTASFIGSRRKTGRCCTCS